MKLFTKVNGQEITKSTTIQNQVLSVNDLLQIKGGDDKGGMVRN